MTTVIKHGPTIHALYPSVEQQQGDGGPLPHSTPGPSVAGVSEQRLAAAGAGGLR